MTDPRDPSGPADAEAPDLLDAATTATPEISAGDGPDPLHRMSLRLGMRVRSASSGARAFLKLLD